MGTCMLFVFSFSSDNVTLSTEQDWHQEHMGFDALAHWKTLIGEVSITPVAQGYYQENEIRHEKCLAPP